MVAEMRQDWARELTLVVMAKAGRAGEVKTRLIPALGAEGAAAVHRLMLACVLERLSRWLGGGGDGGERRVLALAGDRAELGVDVAGWEVVPQGRVIWVLG